MRYELISECEVAYLQNPKTGKILRRWWPPTGALFEPGRTEVPPKINMAYLDSYLLEHVHYSQV